MIVPVVIMAEINDEIAIIEEHYPNSSKTRPEQVKFGGGRGTYCCVPGCKNTRYFHDGETTSIGMFTFPTKQPDLMRKWVSVFNNIRRKSSKDSFDPSKRSTVVCEFHFPVNDIIVSDFHDRKTLRNGAVPSIFQHKVQDKPRRRSPRKRKVVGKLDVPNPSSSEEETEIGENYMAVDDPVPLSHQNCSQCDTGLTTIDNLKVQNEALVKENELLREEVELLKGRLFTFENLSKNEEQFLKCTGLTIDKFRALYELVDPGTKCENMKFNSSASSSDTPKSRNTRKPGPKPKYDAIDQLFMVIVWMKNGFPLSHVAWLFCLPKATVSSLLISWMNYLYLMLGYIPIWPTREQVDLTMPESFKQTYPKTRCIIDCTEIFCQKPSSLRTQSALYSHYKHRVTYKALIGVSPAGAVTFIGQLYDGSISDKEIVRRSGFLSQDFEERDSVMADRGFTIEDELKPLNVDLNIPAFLSGRDQLEHGEVVESQTIAAVRIHVERAIQRVKRFKLIRNEIPLTMHGSINQIWTVACQLTNLMPPLIQKNT